MLPEMQVGALHPQVRLQGWVRYSGSSSRDGAWLQETASHVQQAAPEDVLRVTSCRMQYRKQRHM